MIIKFYKNGWNYIDNVTDVKWLNKRIQYGQIASVSGDIRISEDDKRELSHIIIEQVEEQLEKYNDEYYSKLMVRITDKTYDIIKNKEEEPYLRILCFNTESCRNCLIFSDHGYLLNDNGQTIEKIG